MTHNSCCCCCPGADSAAAPKFNVVHWPLFANQHTDTQKYTNLNRTDKAEVTSADELMLLFLLLLLQLAHKSYACMYICMYRLYMVCMYTSCVCVWCTSVCMYVYWVNAYVTIFAWNLSATILSIAGGAALIFNL